MSNFIEAIGDIITAAFVGGENTSSWIGSALSAITSNPLILMAVILPFVGLGIGLVKRLFLLRPNIFLGGFIPPFFEGGSMFEFIFDAIKNAIIWVFNQFVNLASELLNVTPVINFIKNV